MKAAEFFEKLTQEGGPGAVEIIDGPADAAIRVEPDRLLDVMTFLKEDPACRLDQLSLLSGVDYEDRFECVYHLLSIQLKHDLVIKVHLDKDAPRVASVAEVHPTANWHERETYDLVGIHFEGHPDLRRIYLPEDWVGHPLRKDYAFPDEFNGLPLHDLKGPKEGPEAVPEQKEG